MKLLEIVNRLAQHGHASVSYYEGSRAVRRSFPELHRDVQHAIARLRSYGVGPSTRVGIRASNCYPWLVYDLALIALRAQSVAFPEEFFATEAHVLHERYQLGLLLCYSRDRHPASRIPSATVFFDREEHVNVLTNEGHVRAEGSEFECPSLIFSSGSSGYVKGMRVSRRGVESAVSSFVDRLAPRRDDSLLIFLPMSNYQQRVMCYAALWHGFSIILTDPSHLFGALAELKPTLIVAPPMFYETIAAKLQNLPEMTRRALDYGGRLIDHLPSRALRSAAARLLYREVHKALGGRVRVMLTGMAPIKRSTLEAFERMRLPLFETYGLTECGPITLNVPGDSRIGSVGKALEPGTVQLCADGEIIVRKPFPVTSGYFDAPDGEQATTFMDDGGIRTGDIGYLDEQGFLYLAGRKKELIVTSGGAKVHPERLEAELDASPDVVKSVVFGGPELATLVAVVSVRSAATEILERIQRHVDVVNAQLPASIRVGRVVFTDDAFTRENGLLRPNLKLDRPQIRRRFVAPLAQPQVAVSSVN